ncbi:hypothetical protein JXA88_10735 [Candidatus Fermentibacteria bacterium]|nr:hypothetical protein [Candidatus Fermentibacteria bacterium]
MSKGSSAPDRRKTIAVLSTGIVEYDRRILEDEGRAQSLARRDLTLIGALCEGFRGDVVGRTDSGVVATFVSAADAVECAREVQRQLAESARVLPEREVLCHRIGLHLGDARGSDGQLLGDSAQVATLVQGHAPPGGICLSETLFDAVGHRLVLRTVDLGLHQLSPGGGGVHVYQMVVSGLLVSGQGESRAGQSSSAVQKVFAVLGIAGIVLVAGGAFLAVKALRCASTEGDIPLMEMVEMEPEPEPSAAHEPVSPPQQTPPRVTPAPLPRSTPPSSSQPASPLASSRRSGTAQPFERSPRHDGTPQASVPALSDVSGLTVDEIEQFRELDFNRDGMLSRQEIPFELRSKIMWADADGDGVVTLEELKASRGRRLTQRRSSGVTPE